MSFDDCGLLVDSVVDYAIFMLDLEGRVQTWNRGAERIKGYTADEIIGESFTRFYPEEDVVAGKPERELAIAREHGRVEDEGWRIRKDGSRFWASVVITALRDHRGNLLGFGKVTRDLTARKNAEEQLRQAEQRFHHLVDAVIDYAIFLLDPDGRVSTWNSGAARLKGYTVDEILGNHFSVFYTPEDRAAGKPQAVLEAVRASGRFEDEGWRVRKDGSRFWANVVLTALRDEHGKLIGFAKVTRDLTLRREAEEKDRLLLREQTAREVAEEGERRLRESEARYRALSQRLEIVLEGVADGITVHDRAGQIVFANRAAATVTGFGSPEELMRTPFADVVTRFELLDEDGRPFRSADELPAGRVLNGEPTAAALVRVRERLTQRQWWSHVRATAVLDAQGQPELAVSILHDVTAERRQQTLARHLADVTAALGRWLDNGALLPAMARLLVPSFGHGCVVSLLEDGKLVEITSVKTDHADVPALSESLLLPDVRRALRGGEAVVLDGGSSGVVVPIRVRERSIGVIVLVSTQSRVYDATEIALLEEVGRRAGVAVENAQLYREAHEAARAAEEASRAKDEFLATVSHELRTPLNAILGWSSILKARVSDPGVARPIAVIHRNAQAQVQLIDDILDVSRVIRGNLRIDARPTDVVAIVREGIEVVKPSAIAKKIRVALESPPACPLVADPDRLQQVVWNLLSNAVRFTDAGGEIRVALRQDGSTLTLSVSDTGKGIAPDFLPHVFERFKQADSSATRRVGGLGLGLALVRHIVELHGGQVSAASDGPGKGATFTVVLPIRA